MSDEFERNTGLTGNDDTYSSHIQNSGQDWAGDTQKAEEAAGSSSQPDGQNGSVNWTMYQQNYQQDNASQSSYGGGANNYSYYQQSYDGGPKKRRGHKKPKEKTPMNSWLKVVCFAVIFGLVAGGVFEGVTAVSRAIRGSDAQSNVENTSFANTIRIVKTSSKDVQTIEAHDVSDIVEQTMPSIVAVNTVVQQTKQDFFGRTYSQEGQGAGSGIIFSQSDEQLFVLTNYHVVQGSTSIKVTFNDDSTADATVKGYDENADIAVLVVDLSSLSSETKNNIRVAVLGDSEQLKAGNGAIAIGNALGSGQSVTTGAISAVNRTVQLTDGTMTLIQTSAAINPGNSGGALLNTKGEVIGVNTVKYSDTSVEGMGFAIPINEALQTAEDIVSGKIVNKSDDDSAYLGIQGGTIDAETAEKYGCPTGVYVSNVYSNSAAQRAGIQPGYIITEFNGVRVETMEALQEELEKCNPGDNVQIKVSVPTNEGWSSDEQTLTTMLGSKAEAPQS